MDALNELIKLVTQRRVKKIELFDENNRNKSSNYYKLFDGIHTQKYISDHDAAQDIYQCDPSEKKYLILKTRLKQKLLNTLFFVNIEKGENISSRDVLEQQLIRSLYHVKILLLNQSFKIAIPIIEKIYKQAKSNELTLVSLECTEALMKYHSLENNYKDFMACKAHAERLEQRFVVENKSDRMLEEVKATIRRFKNSTERASKKTKEYLAETSSLLQVFQTKKLENNYLNLKTISTQIESQHKFTLETLNKKETFLVENGNFFSESERKQVESEKMVAYLNLKDYENGKSYLESLKEIDDINTSSDCHRFERESSYLLLALHVREYLEAAKSFNFITENINFKRISETQKEQILIFQAYLHYTYKVEKNKEIRHLINNSRTNFKLRDYIDKRPDFDKKKRGTNLAILNSQILFYLEKLDYAGISDCVEYLGEYCRRYPKKDAYYRSEIFISLLKEARNANFKYYQTNNNTQKLSKELKSMPARYNGNFQDVEIIPYETIWDTILEKVKVDRYG